MSKVHSTPTSSLTLALRKFLVSGFVVFSFVAYAVHDRLSNADPSLIETAPTAEGSHIQLMADAPQPIPTNTSVPAATNAPSATAIPPTVTSQAEGQYIDGVYTGPSTNAYYGRVQVQATVQDGILTDVLFLDYPQDRRTSRRINEIAMPRLTREAVQVQSAYVHIVSGATLTSNAFAQSLYVALNDAAAQS
jgi:uncharacterized protein with FMN-binding domain